MIVTPSSTGAAGASTPQADVLVPRPTDALLVIDVQNDFCAGGALAVPGGDDVVAPINALTGAFDTVVLTQDWHPAGHSSFAGEHPGKAPFDTALFDYGEQTLWPDHCVQGSHGAAFHAELRTAPARMIIRKGFRHAIDSYSAFFENDRCTPTGLAGWLGEHGITRVVCVGLALDYCVRFSAEDARRAGFEALVFEPACRAIDMNGSLDTAYREMRAAGVVLVNP